MARNDPTGPELDVSRPGSLSALYLRLAATLEQSAELAEQHAARLTINGQHDLARAELEQAERAIAAARRCRDRVTPAQKQPRR